MVQGSGALGVLHDMYGTDIPDHFYLGGPATLRGFRQRGVGPHADQHALGGTVSAFFFFFRFLASPYIFNPPDEKSHSNTLLPFAICLRS